MLTLGIWLLSLLKFGCYRENKRREEKSISGRHWKLLPPPPVFQISLSNKSKSAKKVAQRESPPFLCVIAVITRLFIVFSSRCLFVNHFSQFNSSNWGTNRESGVNSHVRRVS